jgi:putative ABC transport system ATP-binding protein
MIHLRNVTRIYNSSEQPVTALNNVSLDISPGEFAAVTGPSGCGKSTLLHLVGALDTASKGEVEVAGLPLHRATETELTDYRRRKLGVVFQFFNLLPTMSVLENVTLPLLLAGTPYAKAKGPAMAILDLVGISHRATHFMHQLSGGEMQRTAIARALVHEPAVLLADEPTGNLDSHNAAGIVELLRKISFSTRTTMLIVTHSEELAEAATRRIRMRDGKILP